MINLAGSGNICEIEENHLNDRLKALVIYYGNLVKNNNEFMELNYD